VSEDKRHEFSFLALFEFLEFPRPCVVKVRATKLVGEVIRDVVLFLKATALRGDGRPQIVRGFRFP